MLEPDYIEYRGVKVCYKAYQHNIEIVDEHLDIILGKGNSYQPERSKREDSLIRDLIESSAADISKIENEPPYPMVWDKDLNFIGHKVIEEMRCSEHYGNIVRDK